MKGLTIGELGERARVNIETVRYYERRGLLPSPPRAVSNYRQYPPETVAIVRFVKRAQELGFSLKEIQELLSLRMMPGAQCADVRDLAQEKIHDIDDNAINEPRSKGGTIMKYLMPLTVIATLSALSLCPTVQSQGVVDNKAELDHITTLMNAGKMSQHTSMNLIVPVNEKWVNELINKLRVNPLDAHSWSSVGMVLASAYQYKEAESAYKHALAINRSDWMSWNNLGSVLDAEGKLKEAEAAYVQATEFSPSSIGFGSWVNLAEVRKKLGDTKGEQEARDKAKATGEAKGIEDYDRINAQLKNMNPQQPAK